MQTAFQYNIYELKTLRPGPGRFLIKKKSMPKCSIFGAASSSRTDGGLGCSRCNFCHTHSRNERKEVLPRRGPYSAAGPTDVLRKTARAQENYAVRESAGLAFQHIGARAQIFDKVDLNSLPCPVDHASLHASLWCSLEAAWVSTDRLKRLAESCLISSSRRRFVQAPCAT